MNRVAILAAALLVSTSAFATQKTTPPPSWPDIAQQQNQTLDNRFNATNTNTVDNRFNPTNTNTNSNDNRFNPTNTVRTGDVTTTAQGGRGGSVGDITNRATGGAGGAGGKAEAQANNQGVQVNTFNKQRLQAPGMAMSFSSGTCVPYGLLASGPGFGGGFQFPDNGGVCPSLEIAKFLAQVGCRDAAIAIAVGGDRIRAVADYPCGTPRPVLRVKY